MLMYVNLYSKDKNANMKFLFNYAGINMVPELQRINGIGQVRILGSRQYAMRVWLNPDRMRAYKVSPDEVMEALSDQSIIGKPGRIGRGDSKQAEALEYFKTVSKAYEIAVINTKDADQAYDDINPSYDDIVNDIDNGAIAPELYQKYVIPNVEYFSLEFLERNWLKILVPDRFQLHKETESIFLFRENILVCKLRSVQSILKEQEKLEKQDY